MNKDPDKLLTTKEAAILLRLSPQTLEKWRTQGRGPKFVKLESKAVRYRYGDLISWYFGD
ncbi:helix-turn-helix transcriptional regulator [Roseovarius sp. S1116L3]|uniref:helix-turn-helix transcriptional regulator n=1 Tax=Roseovarius roseus TaxID=3342636 RepID=UPI003726243B